MSNEPNDKLSPSTNIETGGGASVGGDAHVGGSFVGKDQNTNNSQQTVTVHVNMPPSVAGNADALPATPLSTQEPLPDHPNPYRGLEPFEAEHAHNYFGRKEMVGKLLDKMRATNFVAVVGPSGSGKSSLVRAGLVTALRDGRLEGSREWTVEIIRPGEDPLRALCTPLVMLIAPELTPTKRLKEVREMATAFQDSSLPISDVLADLRDQRPGMPRLLLIFDQFEETFTLCADEALRRAFLQILLAAAATDWLTILFTLRADFYSYILEDEPFGKRVDAGLVNVLPMTQAEHRDAIEQPASQAGRHFEGGLLNRIVNDIEAEPGELPLLEFALTELWDRQSPQGLLTHATYDEIGGVSGAIAKRADETLKRLPADQQLALRRIFTRLVRVAQPEEGAEDTKRRIALNEVEPEIQPLVRQLATARLLVTDRDSETGLETVEVAHEALIRGWGELQVWLNGDREFLLWRQRLRAQVASWVESGRDEGALLRGTLLTEAEQWTTTRAADLSDTERTYVVAGRDAAQATANREARGQRNQRLALATVAMLIVVVLAIIAFSQSQLAKQQANAAATIAAGGTAEAQARRSAESGATSIAIEVGIRKNAEATAVANEAEAQRQSRLSLSRQLASQSALFEGRDDELSLLLATESFSRTYFADGFASLESMASLRRKLSASVYPIQTLAGLVHSAEIYAVAYSPDGAYIVTGSGDKTAKVWSVASGEGVMTLSGHSDEIYAVAYSPDGAYIVTGSRDNTAKVWSVASAEEVMTLSGHVNTVFAVAYSPDGAYIVTGSGDKTAKVWSVATGEEVTTLSGHTDVVRSVAYSPDGAYIVTGSWDRTAKVWSVASSEEVTMLEGHTDLIRSVAYSPDGAYIVTGSRDRTAKVWSMATGKEVTALSGHRASVWSITYSPDGAYIVTGSEDKTAKVWSVVTGEELMTLSGHSDSVYAVAYSPDGRFIVTGSEDKTAKVWQLLKLGQVQLRSSTEGLIDIYYGAHNQVIGAGGDGFLRLWDAESYTSLYAMPGHGVTTTVVIPGCQTCVAALAVDSATQWAVTAGWDGMAIVWDLVGQRAVYTLTGHTDRLIDVALSHAGDLIATSSADGTVKLWTMASGTLRHSFELTGTTPIVAANHLAFSSDDKLLAAASTDGVWLWSTETAALVKTFVGEKIGFNDVAFALKNTYLVAGDQAGNGFVWNLTSDQPIELKGHTKQIWDLDVGPNGALVATASDDGTVRLWEVVTGRERAVFRGHNGGVMRVKFRPDGKQLASGGQDNTIWLWNLERGEAEMILPDAAAGRLFAVLEFQPDQATGALTASGDNPFVWDLDYNVAGDRLVASSSDGAITVYTIDPEELFGLAQQQLTRDFTCEERVRFLYEALDCVALTQAETGQTSQP